MRSVFLPIGGDKAAIIAPPVRAPAASSRPQAEVDRVQGNRKVAEGVIAAA